MEDILHLSRLDEGVGEMSFETVDLYVRAKEVVAGLSGYAETSQVELSLEGGPTQVYAVPDLIGGILTNLCDNAIKYNRPGGKVVVRVGCREGEPFLAVEDTGIGIPAEHRSRIFQRFYRVDKSHSKEVGGTGLGLSIVKHAVQILGGQIDLESAPGEGTTVTVTFSAG